MANRLDTIPDVLLMGPGPSQCLPGGLPGPGPADARATSTPSSWP